MTETKTALCLRLLAEGLSYSEIAAKVGSTKNAVGVLIWQGRNAALRRERRRAERAAAIEAARERERRRNARMTAEQRRERYYRRKCREAGVSL